MVRGKCMNTIRHLDFFDPVQIKDPVHIIGVGAVGSHIANNLARLGIKELTIWDYDIVEDHNIPNQMFFETQLKETKTQAVKETLLQINPDIIVNIKEKYTDEELKGHVFVSVDSINIRNDIYKNNRYNMELLSIYDTRIGLETGQVYTAIWSNPKQQQALFKNSNFKKEEVETPVSACGSKLAVLPTVQMAALIATSSFIQFIKTNTLANTILFNSFNFSIKQYSI